ncbi:protein-export chaperone SecB [Companilactobacillus kimchiensis]|uniref:Preprotein translocase subunit SecB n=1 Tax=Companilactobacillus kimchiensis TaxID=993692 RepID=A0A0R2LJ22_9LACO|nr:protein-export chaperone SecB [Companilactobacillus kimchiensis]KRN98887.1 hypothetical protein IV57_GL000697 [Companilactobacillus kimchiensis]
MNTPNKYLQFEDPTVLKFDFQVNDDFDFDTPEDDTDISTLVEIPDKLDIDFEDDIPVYLTIFINYDGDNAPYKITARIMTLFQISNLLSHDDALQILQNEGASILASYLRPTISMMTASSGFPAMTLPTLDFSDSEND